ncbi:MAG: ATP-binding protein [Oscillospiraceae bacterium]|nr:ATP-binding protein [Oscillospiraceae bacterium]
MSEIKKNPFTPSFGSIPLHLAGREIMLDEILRGINNGPGDPYRSTIFVGARGSGKTVLLARIAEEAASNGWISLNVNADNEMLDEILVQIRDKAVELLTPEILSRITSISFAGFGLSRELTQNTKKSTWRSEMTTILKELNNKGVGLLITVDEVSVSIDALKTLIVNFQHFVRERMDVALIMAGLPHKVSSLLRDDSISFLRRAFQHHLEPIDESEVRYSLKKTIELAGREIETTALEIASLNTKGFPFFIQLIGYQMWRQNPENVCITYNDAIEGIKLAQIELDRMIYETTIRELSDRDVDFLVAMLDDDDYSNMSDIANRMKVTSKYAGVYRQRLITHGIIGSIGIGKVAFELPFFREFLESKYHS